MTIIHTVEDLLHALDENPEWVEALRTRLLTPDLLNLPEKFAQFAAEMNSFVAEMNSFAAETNKFIAETSKFIAETNKFIAETSKFIAETNKFIAKMNSFVAEMNSFAAATDKRFEALETRVQSVQDDVGILKTRVQSVQDDVGILKGAHARNAALREAPFMAGSMGLRWIKDLTPADLWALTEHVPADTPPNELQSFRRADLIMEATDPDNGEICYVAVEISFTVNGRDTTRAQRNAAFLAQLIGKRTYAAVAGLRRDRRVQDLIESGEVFWYQLDPEILEAE